MIPIRLTLRDFLSYAGPDTIDFTGFKVACLSGENGSGKSSLLDAMTWALFGAARGAEGGQNQDRLIRDGADEAIVDFEFQLQEASYRIVRRRQRSGKGEVRFLVAADDDWRNIAGETLRDTEARIAQTLRMDYKTFTASAFFVQNRAEDFLARMRPEERKEVFARLLDLGAYERLEEAARTKAREASVRRTEHARRVAELAGASDELEAVTSALETCESLLKLATAELEAAAELAERKGTAVAELEKAEARFESERSASQEIERSAKQLQRALDERKREVMELDALLGRAEEVLAAQAEIESLGAEEKTCRDAQQRATKLQAERAAAVEEIEGERKVIAARLEERRTQIKTARQKLSELARWEREGERIESVLAGSEDPRPVIEQLRAAAEDQRATEARLSEELRTIDATLADLKERATMLRRGGGECPVCGCELDARHRKEVEQLIRTQTAAVTSRKQTARAERDTARKEAARCGEELRRLERTSAEREAAVADLQAVRVRLESAPALRKEMADLESLASADELLLASGGFAPDLRTSVERLERELEGLYEPAAHRALRDKVDDLTKTYGPLAGRLEEAGTRRAAVLAEIEEGSRQLEEAQAVLARRGEELDELASGLKGLPKAREDLQRAERELADHRRAAISAETELARLQERLEGAKRAAGEGEAAAEAERTAATEHRRFVRLAEAFGRGGIPDLIIDNARPDLEQEANEILGRLTDWDMSVHFAMQRGTKSGKTKETFDVLVHHDGGLRDFAMFSGGEAFRIAFAVRLALSKLLVRRAGARLETLVIDEGFGTQDPAGRERLIEAIHLAQEEFAKVLVITHLDDLKEAFGTQIQVTKDLQKGSVVAVVRA